MFAVAHINVDRNIWILDGKGKPSPGVEFFFAIRTAELPINEVYIYYNLIEGTWTGDTIYYDEWRDLSEEEISKYVENYGLKGMVTDIQDGNVDPRTRMLLAVEQCDIPERLSPDEVWTLVDLVMEGYCGNGKERKRRLGRWYRIVQSIVNRTYERRLMS